MGNREVVSLKTFFTLLKNGNTSMAAVTASANNPINLEHPVLCNKTQLSPVPVNPLTKVVIIGYRILLK